MSHHYQKARARNYQLILKYVAQCMPDGAKERALKAVLATEHGISHKTLDAMIVDLQDAGRIEWDEERKRWRLPTNLKQGASSQ